MALDQPRHVTRRQRRARSESLVEILAASILGLLVLTCLGLLIPIVWSAFEIQPSQIPACNLMKDAVERATCSERLGGQIPRHPAKGATAPLGPRAAE